MCVRNSVNGGFGVCRGKKVTKSRNRENRKLMKGKIEEDRPRKRRARSQWLGVGWIVIRHND